MRKIFRFKYEPCEGTCYAWCDKLTTELNQLSNEQKKGLVNLMVKAHNNLCDNPDYSFGVDVDETNNLFIAHFRTPDKLNLYSDVNFAKCVQKVCDDVLKTEIPVVSDACRYGDNGAEDLGRDILRACIDIAYREEHHQNCACKKAV